MCQALEISANELLSGENLSTEKYKAKAEENILNLAEDSIYKNKLMLTLEWVIGYFSVLILLLLTIVASFVDISTVWKISLILFGFVNCVIGVFFAIRIEKDAGYYECKKCHHKYIPTYKEVVFSSHIGRTRHMKCPKCGEKSWQKKIVE